ncbi:MAG TPA: MFS transporter [Bryobacteraceae bacterium]|nr:MFS transporter [Bryobacteraceae bacterium]
MDHASRLRWFVVAVVVLSSALNYLDRQVLTALAPAIRADFNLSNREYATIIAVFSICYAAASPVMGLVIDRLGVMNGAAFVVAFWSLANAATGLVSTFGGLLLCRAALGTAEAGGIPATGKAFARYLEAKDRAVGTALNQVGITVGSTAAPLLSVWAERSYGWPAAFVASGALGIMWLPLWFAVARRASALPEPVEVHDRGFRVLLRDRRLALLVAANALSMTVYSLWFNWTTLFLVSEYRLPAAEVNQRYAWIPPVFATAGGLFGGWLARRLIRSGVAVLRARLRVGLIGAIAVVSTVAAPLAPTPALATAAICSGLFWVTCMSVNYYALPLDLFGSARAAFAVSCLTGSYGFMQAFLAPLIGDWSERYGWAAACWVIAVMPLASVAVLRPALNQVREAAA